MTENLEATSELQSRLSSLSVSSFPGVTSKNCPSNSEDGLQSTDLSQSPQSAANPQQIEDSAGASLPTNSNPVEPSGQPMDGDSDVNCSNGTRQRPGNEKELPPLKPPSTWTSPAVKDLKAKLRQEKDCMVTVYRGDVMTVHVPTLPDAKKVCWEFATDSYDIGFGIYFDWTPVTTRAITVHISESSDDEDEDEEPEGPVSPGDVEKGSKSAVSSNLGEIVPVYRQDSHLAVQAGSHEFPGEGTYHLKFDNSYSLWRNKTLYYRVYYSA